MSEATIRAAVYAAVSGVSNVGLVYDYERQANEWDALLGFFKSTIGGTTQIRGWMIAYKGIVSAGGGRFSTAKRLSRTQRFYIMGFMGVDDSAASEKTFAALAEDVADALDSDATIHTKPNSAAPANLGLDPAPFAGILAHAAVIQIDVTEIV